jgi:radical SAM protein with 4Fe4S-binding SPASM domain
MFNTADCFASARKIVAFGWRYLKGYFERGRFTPRRVPRLSLETTNVCNARCVFCANPVMERPKQVLDMDLFIKVVDEFIAMGVTEMDFNVVIGEPLLDPHLLKRARYVRRFPQIQTLGFVTTLQWLHRWDLNEFFDSGITWLGVSLTLSGREKYLEFFGVDKYDQMLTNLLTLLEENRKRGNKLAITLGIKPTDEPAGRVLAHSDFQKVARLTDQDLVSVVRDRNFQVDDWLGAVHLPGYLKKRPLIPRWFRPCRLLYQAPVVYSNGNVGACSCRDFEANSELILGNVAAHTLEQLWNGEKLARLRSEWLHRNRVPNTCQTCRHYLY